MHTPAPQQAIGAPFRFRITNFFGLAVQERSSPADFYFRLPLPQVMAIQFLVPGEGVFRRATGWVL